MENVTIIFMRLGTMKTVRRGRRTNMKGCMKKLFVWALVLSMAPLPVSAADTGTGTANEGDAAENEMETGAAWQTDEEDGTGNEDGAQIPSGEEADEGGESLEVPETSQAADGSSVDGSGQTPDAGDDGDTDGAPDAGDQPAEAGTAKAGESEGTVATLYDLEALDESGRLTVEIETKPEGWIYTGAALCPKVLSLSVEEDTGVRTLPAEWYEVSYENNVSCGDQATVTITGKGMQDGDGTESTAGSQDGESAQGCTGTLTRSFSIYLGKPTLSSSSSYSAITVSWTSVAGAALYQVYRSASPNSGFALLGTTTALKWKDAGTKFNASYYYKVEALPAPGSAFGAVSDALMVTKKVAPATVKSAQLSTLTSVKVKWKKVAGAQGYAIYYAASKNGTYKKAKTVTGKNTTSYTVRKLKKGVRYYFKVRAYRNAGKKKRYSDYGAALIMTVPKSKRMSFLFPKGTPKKKSVMEKYLVTITVPIQDVDGNSSVLSLRVHKALADDFQNAFQEMYDIGFPVRAEDTDTYNWRTMASGKSRSHHSYGCVVDINWDSNPMRGVTDGAYRPGVDPYSITAAVVGIWKKYGFYWGGNWTGTKDYMHFSYTNH